MAKKSICETTDCDSPVLCAGLCSACYSWHHYWNNQGVQAAQRYRKKMKRIENRIAARAPPKRAQQAQRGRNESRAHLN